MGLYHPSQPVLLVNAIGTDANSGDLDAIDGIEVGDVMLYLWIGLLRDPAAGGADNYTLRLQIEDPENPGSYNTVANQNSFGQILIQTDTSSPVTSWIIPGWETSTGHRAPFRTPCVVVPGMRLEFDWDPAPDAGDQAQIYGIFNRVGGP